MFYLYAYTKEPFTGHVLDVALVNIHETWKQAIIDRHIQKIYFSDDGLYFTIKLKPLLKKPSVSYEELQQMVIK